MHTMILGAAALIASAFAFTAQAQTQVRAGQADDAIVVSYADLDLGRPDQARVLDHRLKVAARRVCDDAHLAISHYRLRHLCLREALVDAWSQVNAARPMRTAESRVIILAAIPPRRF